MHSRWASAVQSIRYIDSYATPLSILIRLSAPCRQHLYDVPDSQRGSYSSTANFTFFWENVCRIFWVPYMLKSSVASCFRVWQMEGRINNADDKIIHMGKNYHRHPFHGRDSDPCMGRDLRSWAPETTDSFWVHVQIYKLVFRCSPAFTHKYYESLLDEHICMVRKTGTYYEGGITYPLNKAIGILGCDRDQRLEGKCCLHLQGSLTM